ncbi:MAG TPA: M23 family metallopeptidase [Candidatus Dormibacteraeota bacterium]
MRRAALLALAGLLLIACEGTEPTVPDPVLPGATGFFSPLPGAVQTQGFGCTSFALEPWAPECPGRHFHAGVDLAGFPEGTPVLAAAGGLVAAVRFDQRGYGNYMVVDHGHGLSTLYAHLQGADLKAGDPVFRGFRLGRLGSTGMSTGPHLHFEVRTDGRPVDPELFLPAVHLRGGSP